ncbi:hypothetical protein G5B10_13125 [Fluviicola sp. SGL-29]|nr:hypothetical protein [Fluviicola sp. SGL-29]
MNANQKKIVKIVGISAGVLLLIGGIVALIIYKQRQKELADEPTFINNGSGSMGGSYTPTSQSYTPTEIERMQSWLMQVGLTYGNSIIVDSIRTTGGIDGKMGKGFQNALDEAIRKGYVKSLSDLYDKTN